ncbi:hypothetical protein AB0E08_08600 [Streptomyces sp. NPDC048281]|uniref:hypothetical protein n=1 Tax=Streptomyces sp. NPDC048281 TaxID=3154715 RepID=UPI0034124184
MSSSANPEEPSQQPLHQPGGDAAQAEHAVKEVIRWYNARLTEARDSGLNPEAADGLRAARDQALDDLDRLQDAGADETVQIALTYAARLRELSGD